MPRKIIGLITPYGKIVSRKTNGYYAVKNGHITTRIPFYLVQP